MPNGKHNSPKLKRVLPKAAEKMVEKLKDESRLTCQIKNVSETLKESFDRYNSADFWKPDSITDIDEEMKKFEQVFAYRPTEHKLPEYKYNMFRNLLKDLPKGKVKIIANKPEEQHLADQLALLVNALREEEDNGS